MSCWHELVRRVEFGERMITVTSAKELAKQVATAKAAGKKVAFVPTMGALHDGHLSLIKLAQQKADFVVASIFVNPLQFGKNEDFDRYPRTLEADAQKLSSQNTDLLFAPSVDEIYPALTEGEEAKPTKQAGPIGAVLEGAARPGHFDGMLTVVARLFELVQPNIAIFGAKDAQQLFLIRRMAVTDFPGLEIVEAPTVRELGGLAMSSRNAYLSESEHDVAEKIFRALRLARDAASSVNAALQTAQEQLLALAENGTRSSSSPEAKLDYVSLVDAETFEPLDEDFHGRALLLVAVVIGKTRLIDNIEIIF